MHKQVNHLSFQNTCSMIEKIIFSPSKSCHFQCFPQPIYKAAVLFIPPPQNVGGGAILDSLCRVGQSVRPSVCVRSITPLLMEGFPLNLNDTFTATRGCAEPTLPKCQLKVKVTVKCQIFNKQYYTLCCVRSITPLLMEGFHWMCRAHVAHVFSSRSRSQLKVKYITNKYYTFCRVRSITPLLMEGFPSI